MEKELERKIERIINELEYLIQDCKERIKFIQENPRKSVYDENGHQDKEETNSLKWQIERAEKYIDNY